MRIIEIKTQSNGSHENQQFDNILPSDIILPEGYAVIPDDMETPNFPFGEITVKKIGGVMTVTKWVAGTIPEPEPIPDPDPTTDEIMNALLGVIE